MVPDEILEAFIQTLESALREAGLDNPWEFGSKLADWLDKNRTFIEAMRSREALKALAQSCPEEVAIKYSPIVIGFVRLAPTLANRDIMRAIHLEARDNPITVPSGRPRALDDASKHKICDSVSELSRKGAQTSDAQERTAQRFGVSKRTVERIWRQRGQLPEPEPQNLSELIETFKRQIKSTPPG
jgi:hypothetical protein